MATSMVTLACNMTTVYTVYTLSLYRPLWESLNSTFIHHDGSVCNVSGHGFPGSFEAVHCTLYTVHTQRRTFSARGIYIFSAFLTCQISKNVYTADLETQMR